MVSITDDSFYNHPYDVLDRESLQYFGPEENSNKFYIAEVHKGTNGDFRYFANHGRVGTNGAPKAEAFTTLDSAKEKFNKTVKDKKKNGYSKVDLATVAKGSDQGQNKINEDGLKGIIDTSKMNSATSNLDSKVSQLIKQIYEEANQAVSLSLTGSVKSDIKAPLGNLGINGINLARQLLSQLSRAINKNDSNQVRTLSIEYYRNVPRKLASDIRDASTWILNTAQKISKEMDILDLYEDTLRMLPVMGLSDADSKYNALNCDISYITDAEVMSYIYHKIESTHAPNHHYKLRVANAFEVNLKNAPKFNEKVGNVRKLFHGSRSANLVGILSSYLKLPNSLGNGVIKQGEMFGPGIYTASDCTKSYNYSSGSWSGRANKYPTAFLMICEVALGNVHQVQAPHNFQKPPKGFDSVMGCRGAHLYNHEFIVYNPNQVRVKYLVECEKY